MTARSLAVIVALLAAIVFAAGVAEAKGGGGGRGGGGGGGAKPTVTSKPSSASDSSAAKSASSGVTGSGYGVRHGSLSNFFLWAWIFHDFDDDYEEEYGDTNAGFEGWAIAGVGAFGLWFLIRNFRKSFGG